MDKGIISFLQRHNHLNHMGECDINPELAQKFIKGEISEDEFVSNQLTCHKTCRYYMKRGIRIRGETENKDGKYTSHCFRNLSNFILNGENEDYSTTFVAVCKDVEG